MVDAGIRDEDLIVIRIQETAAVGDIVVALMALLKKAAGNLKKKGAPRSRLISACAAR